MQCRGQGIHVVDFAKPAVRTRSGVDNEIEGPAAPGCNHWNPGCHGLDVYLAKRFIVGRCNQNIGDVKSFGKSIVRQPPAEEHVRQVEGAGNRVRMFAFPFTGHPSPNEQVERGMIAAVERLIDLRDGSEQQGNSFEIEKATNEYNQRP